MQSIADGRSDAILNPYRWNNSPRSYTVTIFRLNYFTYLSRVSLARPRDRMTSRTSIACQSPKTYQTTRIAMHF